MRLIELKQISEEELDESHPMTRMMLKAMGDKDPEATIANNMKPKKAYQTSKRAAGARKRPLVTKKMSEARVPRRYQNDDDYGDWMHDVRKDQALDQEYDRRAEERVPVEQRFENAVEHVLDLVDPVERDPDFNDIIEMAARKFKVDAYSLADAVEGILSRGER